MIIRKSITTQHKSDNKRQPPGQVQSEKELPNIAKTNDSKGKYENLIKAK